MTVKRFKAKAHDHGWQDSPIRGSEFPGETPSLIKAYAPGPFALAPRKTRGESEGAGGGMPAVARRRILPRSCPRLAELEPPPVGPPQTVPGRDAAWIGGAGSPVNGRDEPGRLGAPIAPAPVFGAWGPRTAASVRPRGFPAIRTAFDRKFQAGRVNQ